MSLTVFSPAKFNWILLIEGRRPDGYHDLATVFQAVDWGDELVIEPTDDDQCRIECVAGRASGLTGIEGVPTGPGNLVWRAWDLLRKAHPGRVGGVRVDLRKQIPAGAGLGGGSSNAVAMLVGLNRIYSLNLDQSALESLAGRLGSDCPFFVRGGAALGRGRGEQLRPVHNALRELNLVIVWPGFASSTAEAYAGVKQEHFAPGAQAEEMAGALERGDLADVKIKIKNVFEQIVVNRNMLYKPLKGRMLQVELEHLWLSGSGSAMIGLARDGAHAEAAAAALAQWFPVAQAVRLWPRGACVEPC